MRPVRALNTATRHSPHVLIRRSMGSARKSVRRSGRIDQSAPKFPSTVRRLTGARADPRIPRLWRSSPSRRRLGGGENRRLGSTVFVKKMARSTWSSASGSTRRTSRFRHGIYRDSRRATHIPRRAMKVGLHLRRGQTRTISRSSIRSRTSTTASGSSSDRRTATSRLGATSTRSTTGSRANSALHDYDELYWNVTGNGWMSRSTRPGSRSICPGRSSSASALFNRPRGLERERGRGDRGKPGQITIMTTRPLGPYEGLTVAVAFPKGVVDPPSEAQKWLVANRHSPIALAGRRLPA